MPMKTLSMTVTAVSILLGNAAWAGEPQKRTYTDDQINEVLRARGIPPLGGSRVLHDDNAGRTVTTSTVTHIYRPVR